MLLKNMMIKYDDKIIQEDNNHKLDSLIQNEIHLSTNSEVLLFEGIGYDNYTREVWYSEVEDGVDTSLENNPSLETNELYPGVNVYSIFQRKDTSNADYFDNKDGISSVNKKSIKKY